MKTIDKLKATGIAAGSLTLYFLVINFIMFLFGLEYTIMDFVRIPIFFIIFGFITFILFCVAEWIINWVVRRNIKKGK